MISVHNIISLSHVMNKKVNEVTLREMLLLSLGDDEKSNSQNTVSLN